MPVPPPPPVPGNENKKAFSNVLVVIDGDVKGTMKDYGKDNFPVKPEQIKSMNVLKDKQATDKYGNKGKNG